MPKRKKFTARFAALQSVDQYVLWVTLILSAVGVVAVYSAISFLAATKGGGDTEQFLVKHLGRVAWALGAMLIFALIDYRKLARYSKIGVILALGLLFAVQIGGVASGGAVRWIKIGVFGFQPSDIAKVALIIYLAVMLAKKQTYIKEFGRALFPILVWIGAITLAIGMEDLSTAALTFAAAAVMCFVGRVSLFQIGVIGVLLMTLAVGFLMVSPGRAARVESYLGMKLFPNTTAEQVFSAQAEGYQARQARIAFALGGVSGVGPGKSVQRDFLPAPYNDFIFAIIAEEYGAVGALMLLSLFMVLLFRGFLRIARHAPDPLGLFMGVGLTTMLALYGFVHAGVSCGLLPVTGLPMPFVSYGGTSMVAAGVMIGILLNISSQATPDPEAA
jgi:cell division protein FtsW